MPGRGSPGQRGGPAGDLYVTVHVGAHPLFRRSGDDLTLTVPITYAEAALGTTLRVPTLDGAVSLRVAPGTPSGQTLRVRGRGVTTARTSATCSSPSRWPCRRSSSHEAREALEKYAATQAEDPRPEITAALGRGDHG